MDFDADDQEMDLFTVGKKVKIALEDMDYVTWQHDLEEDFNTLYVLVNMVADITPEHDSKLQMLLSTIADKIDHPINPDNRKVIIFTAFSDTAEYLYDHVSAFAQDEYGLHTALVTGSVSGRTTIPRFKADLNNVLTCFSPLSKDKAYFRGPEPAGLRLPHQLRYPLEPGAAGAAIWPYRPHRQPE